ncbi:hypothetical protein ACFW9V_03245 [Streptomyces hygroscopicus]|uniref:hypothetical protein n=1 Tax=Streptomyces hygroscopicus TaxID=1912 RepID=UPI00367595C9
MAHEPEVTTSTEGRDLATYDLVIRRAHVFDGHKALAGPHDVAINGGEIAAVSAEPLRGRKDVDAAEGWVMPGLIDTHLHFYDVLAVSDQESMRRFEEDELPGRLDLFLQHGVTTIKSVGDPTGGDPGDAGQDRCGHATRTAAAGDRLRHHRTRRTSRGHRLRRQPVGTRTVHGRGRQRAADA